MIIYLVMEHDGMPYSDLPSYPVRAFSSKEKAEQKVMEWDKICKEEAEKEGWGSWDFHTIMEIEFEE